jgi:pantothenate kinase
MTEKYFPDYVFVTGQKISTGDLSLSNKKWVIDFAESLVDDYVNAHKARRIVAIAGPSGSGKTFLTMLISDIVAHNTSDVSLVPVTIDAFHFTRKELASTFVDQTNLLHVKGRYDTYDITHLENVLERFQGGENIKIPTYDRVSHDPLPDTLQVSQKNALLIVEGLWVASDKFGWERIQSYFDKVYFLESSESDARMRTIERHVRGGRSMSNAEQFYDTNDAKNRSLVLDSLSRGVERIRWPE